MEEMKNGVVYRCTRFPWKRGFKYIPVVKEMCFTELK